MYGLRPANRAADAIRLREDLPGDFGDPRRTGDPGGGDIRQGRPTALVDRAPDRAPAHGAAPCRVVVRVAPPIAGVGRGSGR
ncbi:hypothetical protein ACIBBB_18140 [Streptomyces sp. NPDC051217]|uniref:hypothetical protein n=1 Tax=Streptomyces sp. NPDC051217 TaxID=3365644 RepID=UPI00378851C7